MLNDVVLNQVLLRFHADDGDLDVHTRWIVQRIKRDGTSFIAGTTWHGGGVADLGDELVRLTRPMSTAA